MKVYHRTYAAKSILADGFKDHEGSYMSNQLFKGVWFSDRPLDVNEGADGDTLLSIEIPESFFTLHEWIEEEKTYRESLIPAIIVNRYGPPQVEDEGKNLI